MCIRGGRLIFFKSVEDDLKYYIYIRKGLAENNFKPPEDITVESLINNDDYINMVDEDLGTEEREISDKQLYIIESPNEYPNYIALTNEFDYFYRNDTFTINAKNSAEQSNYTKIKISVGSNAINKIELINYDHAGKATSEVITDRSKIDYLVKKYNNNTVLLRQKVFNYKNFTLDVTARTISCNTYCAHGVYKPIINTVNTENYLMIFQDKNNRKNVYYYNAIGVDPKGNVTEISDTVPLELTQNDEDMFFELEYSDNYHINTEPTWHTYPETYNVNDEVCIPNEDLACDIVPNLYSHEIQADDSMLTSTGIRKIKIPNMWHVDKVNRRLRRNKVFRVLNLYEYYQSEYSDVLDINKITEINLDKMIILKKNVTGLSNEDKERPIDIDDQDAKIVKIYIRSGGIYYKDYFLNDNAVNNNLDTDVVSIITSDVRNPLLTIKDTCVYSNQYNYTVYLYDEKGNISEPTSVVL